MHPTRRVSRLAVLAVPALLAVSACSSPTAPEVSLDVKVDVRNDREYRINIYAHRELLPVWQASVHAASDSILDFPVSTAEAGPLQFVFFPQDPDPVPALWSDTLELSRGDVVEIVAAAEIEDSSIRVRSP